MARLASAGEPSPWNAARTRAQFGAIAWLRWRMLANSFHRKGGAGELAARIILYPLLAAFALLPTLGGGAGAYLFARSGHLDRIAWLLWATFVLCQLLNINLGQPNSTFDPRLLIRFPLRLRTFTAVRLFFGLLSPANVVGTMIVFAIAVGVTVALPALALYAFVTLAIFAAANVLFSRMIFAWVDRWLSTRRAREVFTGIIFVASLGFQYVNVTFNPAYGRGAHNARSLGHHLSPAANLVHRLQPLLAYLPPGLTASSLVAAHSGRLPSFALFTAACALFAVAFLAVFALRMRTEFRGENLSDAADAVRSERARTMRPSDPRPALALSRAETSATASRTSAILAVLGKEFLYLRRNAGVFYSLIAPVVMVFLFAGRLSTRGSSLWTFPAALLYTLLGVVPLSYNSFGLEGGGAQFYFLAPVRFRDIVLAKNVVNLLLAALELVAVLAIVAHLNKLPSLHILVAAVFWAAATLLVSLVVGNRRSVGAPKRVNPARTASRQASPLSALLSMGILLGCAAVGLAVVWLAKALHAPWLTVAGGAALLALAAPFYLHQLGALDRYALENRETLLTELGKS